MSKSAKRATFPGRTDPNYMKSFALKNEVYDHSNDMNQELFWVINLSYLFAVKLVSLIGHNHISSYMF